ncbi:MAG TPA: VPLPA-CTERM-specific exosortase XrtD [Steroidobacteraceae bacterium]
MDRVTALKQSIAIVRAMSVESLPSFGTNGAVWRFPRSSIVVACLALSVSVWLFWDGLSRMWGWWIDAPEYSHGLLIPPIAAFLIWQQKDRLERLAFEGSWWGVALVLLGGMLLLLGQLATIYTVVQYAYLVTLCGLVLAISGPKPFRLVAAPLLILLFMIPLPQFVLANLSTKLQLLSSQIGVEFIRLFGISVFVEGNVIDLGGYKLQVAEACDGLRYLFPLMTLGFLMAYFYKGASWKRIVLFLSSIPITVFMNSFRVGTIGVMVEHWGISMAEGFLHEFQGWAVFMTSAALMLAEIALLNRLGRESGTWRQLFGVEFPAASPANVPVQRRTMPRSFVGACSVLLTFLAISLSIPRPVEVFPSRASFTQFPLQWDGWIGRNDSLDGIYLDALKLDDYLLANYVNGTAPPVNLYIAYYNSQRKGEAVHSPRSCLPGGGWQLRNFDQRTLADVTINGRPLRVNRTLIELGNQRQLVYYWFQQRGRVITNEFAVKWYLFWDALSRHRTDGALVRLITPLPPAADESDADRRLSQMASHVAPILTRYVPN